MLVPLALLLITFSVSSYAHSVAVEYTPYEFDLGYEILLNCSAQNATPIGAGASYTWTKNGTGINQVEELKDRYEMLEGGAVLRVGPRTRMYDFGDYECHVGDEVVRAWRVHSRPIAKLPPDVDVVEGQTLKLTCKLVSRPYPPVQWLHASWPLDSKNATMVSFEEVSGARVTLRDTAAGVPGGELVLEGVTRDDAGQYSCVPRGGSAAYTIVRVNPVNEDH